MHQSFQILKNHFIIPRISRVYETFDTCSTHQLPVGVLELLLVAEGVDGEVCGLLQVLRVHVQEHHALQQEAPQLEEGM